MYIRVVNLVETRKGIHQMTTTTKHHNQLGVVEMIKEHDFFANFLVPDGKNENVLSCDSKITMRS